MRDDGTRPSVYRFGNFDLDTRSGELRKNGTRIRLQDQPLQILLLLLQHAGELVTRAQIQNKLWPPGTYVDRDNAINSAMRKLREALGDDSGDPRFIETFARRGYRFIGNRDPDDRQQSTQNHVVDLRRSAGATDLGFERGAEGIGQCVSVAVLPFRLLGAAPEDRFLAAALSDTVVNRLGSTGKLLVRPKASVMRYADSPAKWNSVARELNVDLVVEATVQKMGARLRVLIAVHRGSDSATLHSSKHDGTMENLFVFQDQIAEAVCGALVPQAPKGDRPLSPPTQNTLAYELYLRATDMLARLERWDTQTAIEMLSSATGLDPNFADAWAGLAQACLQLAVLFDTDPKWFAQAETAVAKSLQLDGVNPNAFCAQGQILWTPARRFQNAPALRALNAALKINPRCHEARVWRGAILYHLGLHTEAKQDLEAALAAHPGDMRTLVFLGQTALFQGEYEEAYELNSRALSAQPAALWPNMWSPTIALHLGRVSEAMEKIRVARRILPNEPLLAAVEGLAAAHEGDFSRTEQLADAALEQEQSRLHTHHLWHIAASGYAMCAKPEKAISLLQRCAEMGLPNYPLFCSDPHLRSLLDRSDFRDWMATLRREHELSRREFGAHP